MAEQPGQLIYQIVLKGELDPIWAEYFECLAISHDAHGNTLLTGPVIDHTALHSILLKIRDLNLKLVSVNQIEANSRDV